MKKIGIIILLTAIIIQASGQELSSDKQDNKKQSDTLNIDESTKVTIGKNLLKVEDNDSSLNVRVGNRGVNVLESLEGRKIDFEKYEKKDTVNNKCTKKIKNQDSANKDAKLKRCKFKGHWSGVELGFNNYLTSDNSSVLPDEINYMTLRSSKSINFNINFTQLSLGLSKHIGFVTGLGLNWNNYKFNGNNNIQEGPNGIIEILDPGQILKKSKLTTIYLNLPFLLEVQIPVDNCHLNVAAGPIGAVKMGSHSKMVFEDGKKLKTNRDFSLNMLRYGATARAGYGQFQIYGTYYMTPLFRNGKGPADIDLYPFEIGVSFSFDDNCCFHSNNKHRFQSST